MTRRIESSIADNFYTNNFWCSDPSWGHWGSSDGEEVGVELVEEEEGRLSEEQEGRFTLSSLTCEISLDAEVLHSPGRHRA